MSELFKDLVIFELANNHQGSVQHAEYIIRKIGVVARKYGLNAAVKFQYRDLDTFVHPDFKMRTDVKHIPRFFSTRMSRDEFYRLINLVREENLIAMCTPFDEISVGLCVEHGVDILKVASCSAMDWPLLDEVAAAKKPVIISTGGKGISDIDKIYSFFTHRDSDFALLHCVGIYPVEDRQTQLNCIDRMINRYPGISIGYSGHEAPSNITIVQMAIAKGATIFERHVGHATEQIKLNAYSTEIDDIDNWLGAIATAREICGDKKTKRIEESEVISLSELARGCYCANSIQKGERITRAHIFFAMPCAEGQTTSGQYTEGMIATRDYSVNEPIFEKRASSVVMDVRSIIHDVKGMLYEAKVVVGKIFEMELSHHYGMEHFREYGATIINIINREYCKKIIVMLAGQKNPMHLHKKKEETFQVLHGSLLLSLAEKELKINPGEIFTVERGVRHSFTSDEGCIFEEISTTHKRDDSFYDDEGISKMDIINRKTILKDW